ncbi:MAG: flagellar motor protein MotD [Chromatiaceae bacterium]|jgi:chemotaxis protein MotB|nr:flagellar motor protein MotD [Chromatiaceae bacterium]
MARRRRKEEEHENHERWLVSYADFITLLFAFFVVMYAVSSVNEGKYRVLSETLNAVFTVAPRSDEPIQVGERPRDVLVLQDGPLAPHQTNLKAGGDGDARTAAPGEGGIAAAVHDAGIADQGGAGSGRFRADGTALRVADELAISLHEYIDAGLVRITRAGDRIEIEMKERMLFGSGDARISHEALRPLREMGQTLERIPGRVQVEGHTDNVPISTAAYPSNWELSAARAASVAHFLARAGIAPQRLAAVGLGEHHPVASNGDEKGRAANRRVTVVVLAGQDAGEPPLDEELPWAEAPALEPL